MAVPWLWMASATGMAIPLACLLELFFHAWWPNFSESNGHPAGDALSMNIYFGCFSLYMFQTELVEMRNSAKG